MARAKQQAKKTEIQPHQKEQDQQQQQQQQSTQDKPQQKTKEPQAEKSKPTTTTSAKSPRTTPTFVGVKKPHRFKPGVVALREIKKQQRETGSAIPRAAIKRLIVEIGQDYKMDLRWTKEAINALMTASNKLCVEIFRKSNRAAVHAKRETVMPKDMKLSISMDSNFNRMYAKYLEEQEKNDLTERYKDVPQILKALSITI